MFKKKDFKTISNSVIRIPNILAPYRSKRHPLSKIVHLRRCILSRKSQNNLGRCRVEAWMFSVDADAAFPLYVTLCRWEIWFLGPTQPPCTLNGILMTESAVFPQYMHVTTLFGQNSFISMSDSAVSALTSSRDIVTDTYTDFICFSSCCVWTLKK